MSYDKFAADRDLKGRTVELLTIQYFLARGFPASLNEASEDDYAGRASHDIVVAGEKWECKLDLVAGESRRIFVEKASLEHTQSHRFCYWLPTPYGMEVRIFTVEQLIAMYDERSETPDFNGGISSLFTYKRANAGDQANNEGIFVPLEAVKKFGKAPWEVMKEFRELRNAA